MDFSMLRSSEMKYNRRDIASMESTRKAEATTNLQENVRRRCIILHLSENNVDNVLTDVPDWTKNDQELREKSDHS